RVSIETQFDRHFLGGRGRHRRRRGRQGLQKPSTLHAATVRQTRDSHHISGAVCRKYGDCARVAPPPPTWHPPCSKNRHEPPNCLLFIDFAPRAVTIGHTRVTFRHHSASAESLAIIENSRSILLGPTTLRMKCISIFLLGAAAVCAADFTPGKAARLVIGQTTFTSQDSNSSDIILGAASGIAYAADTLFVADSNRVGASPTNHRVLLYQNLSGMLPRPTDPLTYNTKCPVCVGRATLVLGQPDFTTTTLSFVASSATLRLPTAVASDGVHLVVGDTDHNRVLIWNRIPTTNNQPAD